MTDDQDRLKETIVKYNSGKGVDDWELSLLIDAYTKLETILISFGPEYSLFLWKIRLELESLNRFKSNRELALKV